MAIELPSEVAKFLQFIGIDWPQINEDKVRDFGTHLREFASNLQDAHQQAAGTVRQLGQSYQGSGYEALMEKWASTSTQHLNELVDGCNVVAGALDVAADAIVAMKVAAIGELVAMAVSFAADQAAAVLTFGIAEAAEAAIIAAGKECVEFLKQQLIQHVTNEVIDAAVTPLMGKVSSAVSGLIFQSAAAAAGVAGGGGGGGSGFSIDTEAVKTYATTMRQHADTVAGYANTFAANAGSVDFT
jgi:type VII secretion system (Wss) protein ESAT-6